MRSIKIAPLETDPLETGVSVQEPVGKKCTYRNRIGQGPATDTGTERACAVAVARLIAGEEGLVKEHNVHMISLGCSFDIVTLIWTYPRVKRHHRQCREHTSG